MPTLRNPLLKMERAKFHLETLERFLGAWVDSKPYRFSQADDLERQEHVMTIELTDPPFEAALIAGDFICCLRSSLDYLAWQLAALTTRSPSKRVCFPIYSENTSDSQASITKSTVGIPVDAVALIKSFQPYQTNDYATAPLWILHNLWNIDKHRHIPLHSGYIDLHLGALPGAPKPVRLDTSDEHGTIVFPLTDKPDLSLCPPPTVEIQFGDSNEGIVVNTERLREIYEFVSQIVIPAFTDFFA
jgi:hypothetical protein